MRILLDHCVDIRLKNHLPGHEVLHTKELGWEDLTNGKLLSAAEDGQFAVFLTVDKNLRFQQNIAKRKLAVVTLVPLFTVIEQLVVLIPAVLELFEAGVLDGKSYVIPDEKS
ncbi:MAG: DUF5615 family PIN-like protein [Armatimonadetes bacterium]|nr:hypothetical protein [Armatimonadota bacterium]MBS1701440.1 DUF5615 family PIN-like protein [Armatimonadota bacterium]MBS1726861.1 DUF5615 family PIN-like protein [Armatimonadota bacterium]